MIKKVIMFIESPFNKRDYNRFGIETLQSNGFEVEVWDLTSVFHPGIDLSPRDPFEFSGLKIFREKKIVVKSILRLTPEDMIILWFDYANFTYYWLYRAMSKSKVSYSSLLVYTPVPHYEVTETFISKIKRVFARCPLKVRLRIVRNKLFSLIPYKYLGIKPAVYRFVSTEGSLEHCFYPNDNSTKTVFLHAFDYNLYLEKNKEKAAESAEGAVFLDNYLPFHEDDDMVGVMHWVTADNYYPNLCRFFDYVEREQNLKVDIAAHPRSFYERHPGYFDKRRLHTGRTIECVRDAKFVITHDSNAVNFAVLYYKPIIFTITEEMVQNKVAYAAYRYASWFGKTPINIDRPLSIDWAKELRVDKEQYDMFRDRFIKKRGTEDIDLWQTVADKLKELS